MDRNRSEKGVGYIRTAVSDSQAEATQAWEIEKLVESLECQLVATFTDSGLSGIRTDRSGLQAMLEHIENNPIGYLLIRHIDRLSRDSKCLMDLVSRINAAGVCIVTSHGLASPEHIEDLGRAALRPTTFRPSRRPRRARKL